MKFNRSDIIIVVFLLFIISNSVSPLGESMSMPDITNKKDQAANNDPINLNIDNYIWPTDASRKITSSFAEYRSSHFHGGIDISTNGQNGYNVFAVADGYVNRIRIQTNGYGKMLFMKHYDGYVSTYAHLENFNEEIKQIARAEQHLKGTYAIDLLLDSNKLPIKKGDVIAFTGETGFGPPHLHFEIRDENLNPINPLLSKNLVVEDNLSPIIKRVMIDPLTFSSYVDNRFESKYFSHFPRNKGMLQIPQPIRLHGQIGFGVEAFDRSDGNWSKSGIYRMEMYIDDSLTFSMELNRVLVEETKQIDLHYDYPSNLQGRGKFQKLYIDQGNVLPFYDNKPTGAGIIDTEKLTEGKHEYRIVCSDITGNSTELKGTFISNHKPTILIESIDKQEVIIKGKNLESITKCVVYGRRTFQTDWSQHTLPKSRFEYDGTDISLPVNTKPYDVIKLIAETNTGSISSPTFHFIKKPFGPVQTIYIDTEVLKDYVRIDVTTPGVFTETPKLSIQEGTIMRIISPEAIDVNKYTAAFVPADSIIGERVINVSAEVNGKSVTAEEKIILYPIPANRSGSFYFDSNKLQISYDSGAVYKPLYLQIQIENERRLPRYKLSPQDVLINRGLKVTITPAIEADNNHLGLYYRSTGGWIFRTKETDNNFETLSTTLNRTLGEIAIFEDKIAPTFGKLRVLPKKNNVFISFRYYDNLSGVDCDEIKLYIDDMLVIPEIDGEHHRVWYQSEEPLNRGKHKLKITMKDKSKNETEISRIFSIK
ncbi:MAG: M23 family metallopeptidase [Bacteroidota bacterium]|nr:M23 family metallopeptidase [Bacteroidota bacterium]